MRYYLIAGEASGDLHGSNLIRGLAAEDPQAEFRFWGGDLMREAAEEHDAPFTLVHHYRDGAVMGLAEVLSKGFRLLENLHGCEKDIMEWKPDVVILIDYPGFNMKVAKFCHARGQKVFYYIAPKTWASREGRNRQLKELVDRLFIVFPFEVPYFTASGIPFTYEGNPLVDAVDSHNYSRPETDKYIALLAGSRKAEISRMMPVLMQMADRLAGTAEYRDWKFIIAGAPARGESDYTKYIGGRKNVRLIFDRTYDILKYAEAAVINSGTASLEAALIGTPQVVGWNTSPLTWFAARHILKVQDHIKYISLGNLCLDRQVFKEYIQDNFTPESIEKEIRRILEDGQYREEMLQGYAQIRESLGGSGASRKVAAAMIKELKTQ